MRSDSNPSPPAQRRLQAAFGVPVLTDVDAEPSASGRSLAAAIRPGRVRPWLLTAALVLILLTVGAVSAARSVPQPLAATQPAAQSQTAGVPDGADDPSGGQGLEVGPDVVVHVAGAVATPGVVTLPLGSRVAEAVGAAGGALPGTSLDGLNLARRVNDGEQVVVGGPTVAAPAADPGAVPSAPGAGPDAAAGGDLIDLNTASSTELQELPRVGPATAEKIIAHREANGRFTAVDQLLDIPGIGERTLAGLRDLVRV